MKNFIIRHKWPLAIFLAAFFIRLVYLIQTASSNPAFYYPMVDELWNLNWAKDILSGNFRGDGAYFRGPLYPYFLALLLKITDSSLLWVRIIQIIIASLSAVMVYQIGIKLFSKKISVLAGFLYAIYGTLIFYESMLLIPVLFILLNLIGVYLLLHYQYSERFAHWLLAGIVIGLSAIARPNILLLVPLFMIWIFYKSATPKTAKSIGRSFIYLLGVLIPVFAVTARNIAVTGEAILISSQGGVNLYIGNNPDTDGLTMLIPEVDLDESLPWTEFNATTHRIAEEKSNRRLTPSEASSFWTGKTIDFVLSNPGKFVEITFKKCVYLLLGFENSDQTDIYFSRGYSSLLSVLLWKSVIYFPFGLLLPLAIVGIVNTWRNRKKLLLLYLFILGYIPTIVLFLVTARHRLPIVPFIILLSAAGIIGLFNFYQNKNWRKLGTLAILTVLSIIIVNQKYFEIGFENTAQIHFNLALTYDRQGDLDKAEAEYAKSIEIDPSSAVTLNNLGFVQYRLGKMNKALSNFHKAIRQDPNLAEGYNNIGLVHESRNDLENAELFYQRALGKNPELYQTHLNLGDVYLARQDYARSEVAYRQAWIIDSSQIAALTKLGGLFARQQEFSQAEEMFLAAEGMDNLSAPDYTNWGNVYFATAQPEMAIEKYRKAIAADPNFARAYFTMAATFDSFGYVRDSVDKYARKAVELDPSFTPARQLLNSLE